MVKEFKFYLENVNFYFCLSNDYPTFYYKVTYFSTLINVSWTLINILLI